MLTSSHWRRYCRLWTDDSGWAALVHLAVVVAGVVIWRTIVDQSKTYAFNEWTLKFVPYILDSKPLDWFGTWEMGDPRARLVTVMATRLDIEMRGRLSEWMVLPPSFGLNWLIYPLVVFCLYRFARNLTGSRNVALGAATLWAVSPPALDSLVCCYVPAKALMNLWFVGAGWGGTAYLHRFDATANNRKSSRRAVGVLGILSAITLAALLTDETAIFIVICLPVLLAGGYWRTLRVRDFRRLGLAVGVACLGFAVVALVLYPWINRRHGQVPLRLIPAALQGPGVALIGSAGGSNLVSGHFTREHFLQNFQPLSLAYTMFSASLIPTRKVVGVWMDAQPLLPSLWPLWEVVILCFAGLSSAGLAALLPARLRWLLLWLLLAMIVLIFAYGVLLVPLGAALLEIHYYGALFSILFAIGAATLMLGSAAGGGLGLLAVAGLMLITALEFLGYEATAKRTVGYFDTYYSVAGHVVASGMRRSWHSIKEIETAVHRGQFEAVAAAHPYPSRDFYYAFELEAWRRHRRGERVDIAPLDISHSFYGHLLDLQSENLKRGGYRDPSLIPLPTAVELSARGARRLESQAITRIIHNHTWHGSNPRWTFTLSFDSAGRFVGRFWLDSLIRVWAQSGVAMQQTKPALDIQGLSVGDYPIDQIYELNGTYYAFDAMNTGLFQFRLIPTPNWPE
jgi:hypothetical protein